MPETPYCPMCGAKQVSEPRKATKRSNGQGTVYKRGNGYEAQVVKYYFTNERGKRVAKKVRKSGFKTKRDALEYIPILKGSKDKKVSTLEDHWRVWENADLPKLSASKQDAYTRAKKRLEDVFHTPIDQITIEDLQTVVDKEVKTFYPARDMKSLLSHLYKRAMAQREVNVNLSSFIALPELDEEEPQPFSKDEQNAFWKLYAENDQFVLYILLMIYTGMMPGELIDAKKEMINWENQIIIGSGKKTKKRKETPIVLPDIIIPVLKRICEISQSDKLMNFNKNYFYKEYHACLERANVRHLSPYSCRHTTGTALGTSEIPLAIVKEIMRHTKITTTERYFHIDSDTMLKAANKARSAPIAQDA